MARSNKTEQVMRLVRGDKPAPKATENTAKEKTGNREGRIITEDFNTKLTQDVPKNPALRIPDEEKVFEKRLVHIPTELLNEQLRPTLMRFNVCGCDICTAVITEMVISELPNRFVKVDAPEDESNLKLALDEMRPELIKTLAKMCIKAKTKPLHDEK